jgi:signal transduction histidine kinase
VVSEALTNVVRHAGATHAEVALRIEGRRLVIEVRDDGTGGADLGKGSGLRGLADRVGALDGSLRVEDAQGGGTVVHARVPLV